MFMWREQGFNFSPLHKSVVCSAPVKTRKCEEIQLNLKMWLHTSRDFNVALSIPLWSNTHHTGTEFLLASSSWVLKPVIWLLINRNRWNRVFLERLTVIPLIKKFPAIYGSRRFITVFTRTLHLFLSRSGLIKSKPPLIIFLRDSFY